MTSIRFGLQPIRERLPTPHQVADAHGFFRMPGNNLLQRLHFVHQQAKRLLWLDRCRRHLLVLCERVSGQDYAVVGDLISGHGARFYEGIFR